MVLRRFRSFLWVTYVLSLLSLASAYRLPLQTQLIGRREATKLGAHHVHFGKPALLSTNVRMEGGVGVWQSEQRTRGWMERARAFFRSGSKAVRCLAACLAILFFSFRAPKVMAHNMAVVGLSAQQMEKVARVPQVRKKVVAVEVVASQPAETAHGDEREETSESSFEGGPVEQEVQRSWYQLRKSLQGAKLDSLIMLMATSAVIPLFKKLNTSPIVGFLLTGTLIGPLGLNWVKDLHTIDALGELGIVFFLFEMGLELSLERLKVFYPLFFITFIARGILSPSH